MAGGYSLGSGVDAIDSTEVFCFANCKGSGGWRLTTSLPEPLTYLRGATFNGHFRVIGGANGNQMVQWSNKVFIWCPSEEVWRTDTPLLDPPEFRHAVTVTTKDLCT